MKRFLLILTLLVFILTIIPVAYADVEYLMSKQHVYIEGKIFEIVYNINGSNFVSVTELANKLGYKVDYDPVSVNVYKPITKVTESVFAIDIFKTNSIEYGAGVAIGQHEILTCYHVVDGAKSFLIKTYDSENKLLHDENIMPDNVITTKKAGSAFGMIDFAIIKSKKELKPVSITKEPKIGEKVFIVGNPYRQANTVTEGTFSGYGVLNGYNYMKFTGLVNYGNSGGGLFNENGELIGITARMFIDDDKKTCNIGYAIPIDDIMKELQGSN